MILSFFPPSTERWGLQLPRRKIPGFVGFNLTCNVPVILEKKWINKPRFYGAGTCIGGPYQSNLNHGVKHPGKEKKSVVETGSQMLQVPPIAIVVRQTWQWTLNYLQITSH